MKNKIHKKIIGLIEKNSEQNPEQRFGQLIFNLAINEFEENKLDLRDIYNDLDEDILKRIELRLEWFDFQSKVSNKIEPFKNVINGMTVNERLYVTNLMIEFDKYKKEKPEFARFILQSLKIDSDSIQKILNN